jgi:nucleoside-diphosphate-sugar epimerase
LPFGNSGNRRSIVYVGNLNALIKTVIDRKATGIFVAGDTEPLSTGDMIALIRRAMGRKPGLFSVPVFFRTIIKKLKPRLYIRLFGSYEVKNEQTNRALNFAPPFSSEAGMKQMTDWYLKEESGKWKVESGKL